MDEYVCGHIRGTVYGPAEGLDKDLQRFRRMNYEEYSSYIKKVDETKGFEVDGCSGFLDGGIAPLHRSSREWAVAEEVTVAALAKLGNIMDKKIGFVFLAKANVQAVRGLMYYLTFTGITNDVESSYKMKVWYYCTKSGIDCQILYFEDELEAKDLDEQNITFCFRADNKLNFRRFRAGSETIAPKPGQILRDAFNVLVEELKRQTQTSYAKARRAASLKWKRFKYPEKSPYTKEAWERFKKKNAKYYPEYSGMLEES